MRKHAKGFTLVELLIVVVIMAVLAATVIPEFSSSTVDAQKNTAEFNLNTIRSLIQTFKAQHRNATPSALDKLTVLTDNMQKEAGDAGVGDLLYGPYLSEIPEETIAGSNAVAVDSATTAAAISVTGTTGGWIYKPFTGEIRINHTDYSSL
ncbi:MAG: type II secretion system protein [Pirellulaceae bacterium]|jgi:prepilin-type N-terminal cleavage/methylation domain-containing protein|nr:type II secretion system protein [Planctomycetaceae bacterium]